MIDMQRPILPIEIEWHELWIGRSQVLSVERTLLDNRDVLESDVQLPDAFATIE